MEEYILSNDINSKQKCFVRDKLIYTEYGILTMNEGPGAIAPEAFEK